LIELCSEFCGKLEAETSTTSIEYWLEIRLHFYFFYKSKERKQNLFSFFSLVGSERYWVVLWSSFVNRCWSMILWMQCYYHWHVEYVLTMLCLETSSILLGRFGVAVLILRQNFSRIQTSIWLGFLLMISVSSVFLLLPLFKTMAAVLKQ